MPPGVINMLPGDGLDVSKVALRHPDLAGIHFTGSTPTFQHLWRTVGQNIASYRAYPRIVGETGGKDFIVAHPVADPDVVRVAMIRGAFEFQGQKCSAASRAYVPRSVWTTIKDQLIADTEALSMGDVTDLSHFMGAVIDDRSFAKQKAAIARAKRRTTSPSWPAARSTTRSATSCGRRSSSRPTRPTRCSGRVLRPDPRRPRLRGRPLRAGRAQMESFAPYALTGAIIAQDRAAIAWAAGARFAAGQLLHQRQAEPVPSSASSPSVAVARRAPTTRPARRSTCSAGPRPARSRRPSSRRRTTATRQA